MPYDASRDPLARRASGASSPGRAAHVATPSDTADLTVYAKALRVYVPAGTATPMVRVTPVEAVNDGDTVDLPFTEGLTVEPLGVRRIWASGTSAGITIHTYHG